MRFIRKIPLFLQISFWCALVLHVFIFLFFQVRSRYLSDKKSEMRPYVKYISNDSLSSDVELEEYAMLFDSAPLFIPTVWNASQSLEVEFEDVTLDQFPEFEPQIDILEELHPKSLLIMDDFQIDEPLDLLASRFWRFFEGFGKAEMPAPAVAFTDTSPLAEVSVLDPIEDQSMLVPVDLGVTTLFSVNRPVVFNMRVFKSGLSVSVPTLVQTSGSDAFDQSVAEWMLRPDVIMKWPEGYLEIRVFSW